MASELEIKDKNQKELETDLTSAKHKLLEVQHQLNMAEKVMFFFGNIKDFLPTYLSIMGRIMCNLVKCFGRPKVFWH